MAYLSDPSASVSVAAAVAVVLKKQLSAHGDYGVQDGCDILYSGENGVWTFDLSNFSQSLLSANNAFLEASLVLDDHYEADVTQYQGTIQVNDNVLHSGSLSSLGVAHGSPHGGRFSNWQSLQFPIGEINGQELTVKIDNSSEVEGGWIAIDTIELSIELCS